MSVLDLLLSADRPDARKDLKTCEVEIPRLSTETDKAIFKVRQLTYDEYINIRSLPESGQDFAIILSGVIDPNLKDKKLLDASRGIHTQDDLIRSLFTPGEITKLIVKINSLSGYSASSVVDLKNE